MAAAAPLTDPVELRRRNRNLLGAAATLAGVALIARVPVADMAPLDVATCAVLLLAAGNVARRGSPYLISAAGRLPGWIPLAAASLFTAGSAWLLLGPLAPALHAPSAWSFHGVLLVTAIPVAEELFFRGTLLRILPRARGLSVVGSAAMFGLLHLQLGWQVALGMALAGCALGGLALATRSLALPIALHACFNGLATAYQEGRPWYLVGPLALVLGLWVVSWVVRRRSP